jgi:YesN/AraC family two-component response regulator
MDKPRILIVDDEEGVRDSLRRYLDRNIECVIREASNGRDALDEVNKEPYDLILLDVKMPGISGIDVLKQIQESSREVEVLVITAYDSQQVAQEALALGASDYIVKPSTIEVIFDKISEILQRRDKFLPKAQNS